MIRLGLFLIVFLAFGCAQKPTRVSVKKAPSAEMLAKRAKLPVKVTSRTIVVDARTRFEYQMAHYPGSVHLRWESFTNPKGKSPGRISGESKILVQRLALKGLHPDKQVIVVGDGTQGDSSSARLAWTLFFLGIKDVQVVDKSVLGLTSNITDESQKVKNADMWTPPDGEVLIASKDELLDALKANPRGPRNVIIDVRSEAEYLKKKGFGRKYAVPELGALNIEWKEFFDSEGRPSFQLKRKLKGIGVRSKSKIILVSDNGIRASAAHFSLLALGFKNSKTLIDGYKGLIPSSTGFR